TIRTPAALLCSERTGALTRPRSTLEPLAARPGVWRDERSSMSDRPHDSERDGHLRRVRVSRNNVGSTTADKGPTLVSLSVTLNHDPPPRTGTKPAQCQRS